MAKVELKNVCKIYDGGVKAVDNVDVTIEDKEFVVLVGPSGCGKSTTLRMVAGLESISDGELLIDGEIMNDIPPKDRNIAMVFQNYALYPHMSVYENMAFGLRIKKHPKEVIDARVKEAAKILDIEDYLERKPKALSGGQRQRVAVGRAIVRKPKVFLFDEPLSNLDAKLRVQMRAEIVALHNRLQATIIYVTHDQVEAMTMGDKIVVMKDGIVQQVGSPLHIYNNPVNKFVAGFIGSPPMNFIPGKVLEKDGRIVVDDGALHGPTSPEHRSYLEPYIGKNIIIGIRPEDFNYAESEKDTMISGEVTMCEQLGAQIILHFTTDGGHEVQANMLPDHVYKPGERVNMTLKQQKVKYFDVDTEKAILPDLY